MRAPERLYLSLRLCLCRVSANLTLLARCRYNWASALAPVSCMNTEPSNTVRTRRLPWSIANVTLNSVFAQITFGGPIFILFLDHLGLPKSSIGFLLSLFPFCGL